MSGFGYDANGVYKTLRDGRVLRISQRMYNVQMTLSENQEAWWWIEAW